MKRSLLAIVLGTTLALVAAVLAAGTWAASAPTAQTLTFDKSSYSFTAAVGDSATQTLTVSYSGKGSSGKLSLGIGGANFVYFVTRTDNCSGTALSTKRPTCTVDVVFDSNANPGNYSAVIQVEGRTATGHASLSGTTEAATLPGLSINDRTQAYGSNMIFTVTMSQPSTTPVTFDWATADGSAVWVSGTTCGGFNGPNDYVAGSGSKTITAGSTSTTISVVTCSTGPGNRTPDPTTFTVTISNPSGATITDGTGTGTLNPT